MNLFCKVSFGAWVTAMGTNAAIVACASENDKVVHGSGGATTASGASGGARSGSGGSSSNGTDVDSGTSTGGAAAASVMLYGFDSNSQNFKFNSVVSSDPPWVNPYAPGAAGMGGGVFQIEYSSKDFDESSPQPGSLKVTATFSEWNDVLGVEVNGPVDTNGKPVDLSNMILNAKVLLEKGLSPAPSAPGIVDFYLKSGSNWAWARNGYGTQLSYYGIWYDVRFDVSNPLPDDLSPDFDPAHPVQLGFEFMTMGNSSSGAFGAPLETVIYIDDIIMLPKN